jgi:hypothetical protein
LLLMLKSFFFLAVLRKVKNMMFSIK